MLGGRVVGYPDLGVEALRAPGVTFDFVANPDPKFRQEPLAPAPRRQRREAAVNAALTAGATGASEFVPAGQAGRLLEEVLPAEDHYAAVAAEEDPDLVNR